MQPQRIEWPRVGATSIGQPVVDVYIRRLRGKLDRQERIETVTVWLASPSNNRRPMVVTWATFADQVVSNWLLPARKETGAVQLRVDPPGMVSFTSWRPPGGVCVCKCPSVAVTASPA